jgi:hypothetical protein
VRWLILSLALSLGLTALLNVGFRAFPGAGHRLTRSLAKPTPAHLDDARTHDRRVRVFVPWRAMIAASLVLTIVLNLVLWIT